MATYPSVNVNYNVRDNAVAPAYIPSAFIVGVSQRGPCYRVVTITDVNQFLDVFGQPTNKFEYDFFKAVKTTVFSRSIAYCYRIPYSDKGKCLYDAKFKYVLKQTADNLTQLQYDISSTSKISDIVDGKEAIFEFTPINDFESIIEISGKPDSTSGNSSNDNNGDTDDGNNGNDDNGNTGSGDNGNDNNGGNNGNQTNINTNLSSWIGDINGNGSTLIKGSTITIYNETLESLNSKYDQENTTISGRIDKIYDSPNPTGRIPEFPENPTEWQSFEFDDIAVDDGYYLNGKDIVFEKATFTNGGNTIPCFKIRLIRSYHYRDTDGGWIPDTNDLYLYKDGSQWRVATSNGWWGIVYDDLSWSSYPRGNIEVSYDDDDVNFTRNGGSSGIEVHPDGDISWHAESSDPTWLSITGGSSGTGYGCVFITVSDYDGDSPRIGAITIGNNVVTITQYATDTRSIAIKDQNNGTNLTAYIEDTLYLRVRESTFTIYNETLDSLNTKYNQDNTTISGKFVFDSPKPIGKIEFPENPTEWQLFDIDGTATEDEYYLNDHDVVFEKGIMLDPVTATHPELDPVPWIVNGHEVPCFKVRVIDSYRYLAAEGGWVPLYNEICIWRDDDDNWEISTIQWTSMWCSSDLNLNSDDPSEKTISISDKKLSCISNDIDPEYRIGIIPVFFGAKDAENLYDLKFSDLFYFDKTDITREQNYIDKFNTYVCNKDNSQYLINSKELTSLFKEYERSNHFTYDWFQKEIGKFIDNFAPKDTDEFRNTMGIAFVEFFFDDQHKLDYKILEAYYGLVGYATDNYDNLEEIINSQSNFYHVDITGFIDKFTYIQALGKGSLLSGEYVVPMTSPYKSSDIKTIEALNVFDEIPTSKFDDNYCYSLKTFYERLKKTEYLNSAPFDYVLFPGLTDIFCLENQSTDYNTYDGLLPYKRSVFIVDPSDNYDDIKNIDSLNIMNLNKFLARMTDLGDKGILAFLDIPEVFNQYFKDNLDKCYNDSDTKKMISDRDKGNLESFIPDLKSPLAGLYDRTYPLFNYQYVDKDFELTRYKRLELDHERFELIPGSIMVLRAYLRNDLYQDFYPIAGPRSVDKFPLCHRCFTDKKDTNLFKILYDAYGIASMVNDRDNNTFVVQQTTWNRSTSIFKQIHALRTYKALKRQVLDALYQRIYDPNILDNRKSLKTELQSILARFKEAKLIDDNSDAFVWALIEDIENNQINCQVVVGIFGAIVKIVLNMNLTSATIDYTES